MFTEYLKYFAEKQRVGVVTLKKHVLYIVPPIDAARAQHSFKDNQLLGILANLDESTQQGIILPNFALITYRCSQSRTKRKSEKRI